jgi:hypothetical protein
MYGPYLLPKGTVSVAMGSIRFLHLLPLFKEIVSRFHCIGALVGMGPHELVFNLVINKGNLLNQFALKREEDLINKGLVPTLVRMGEQNIFHLSNTVVPILRGKSLETILGY